MHFFHRDRPKNDGRRLHTNIRIMNSEDAQSIISDLWHELEVEEIILVFQTVQHHDVVKIGHILRMTEKIHLQ